VVIAVDLFFNAGVFASLFDQSREPALLPDPVLFRRIPFAYLFLLIGVMALAWLLRRIDAGGGRAIRVGAVVGALIGLLGLGALWTALDITGGFVVAGILVVSVQGAAAGAVLTSPKANRSLAVWVIVAFVLLTATGQVVANLVA
jgi:hypothetical protein